MGMETLVPSGMFWKSDREKDEETETILISTTDARGL